MCSRWSSSVGAQLCSQGRTGTSPTRQTAQQGYFSHSIPCWNCCSGSPGLRCTLSAELWAFGCRAVSNAGGYLVRVAFGAALLASVTVVWTAILAVMSSSNNSDDRRSQCASAAVQCSLLQAQSLRAAAELALLQLATACVSALAATQVLFGLTCSLDKSHSVCSHQEQINPEPV